jgi:hypothetical protein
MFPPVAVLLVYLVLSHYARLVTAPRYSIYRDGVRSPINLPAESGTARAELRINDVYRCKNTNRNLAPLFTDTSTSVQRWLFPCTMPVPPRKSMRRFITGSNFYSYECDPIAVDVVTHSTNRSITP